MRKRCCPLTRVRIYAHAGLVSFTMSVAANMRSLRHTMWSCCTSKGFFCAILLNSV
jgi:hypothetical protein